MTGGGGDSATSGGDVFVVGGGRDSATVGGDVSVTGGGGVVD